MIEIYYYENSICAERVLMLLAEKDFDDWVPHHIDLFKREQFTPEYLKLNPKAQVPTLVHDGQIIRESSIICDYLDDILPGPSFKPEGRIARAQMQELIKDTDESGFEGVGALSFTAVFREKLLTMSAADREAYWGAQTDIARTLRQKSCVEEGLASSYALRALAAWDRIFGKTEEKIADGRPWLMGQDISLADINFAPFVARLDAIRFLDIWLDERPATRAWWDRLRVRPSCAKAKVGPAEGEETESYAREGAKIAGDARKQLDAIRERLRR